jgi:hypothetical protein
VRSWCAALAASLLAGCGSAAPDRLPPLLSDRAAARAVHAQPRELRPANRAANRTRPTSEELARFRAVQTAKLCRPYVSRVSGDDTGTTDEIIQWAAVKWGLDPDVVRAVAVAESGWDMAFVGDGGASFGITQIKRSAHPGTYPLSARSTAFNLDYYGSVIRCYLAGGAPWLDRVEHARPYERGDLWGSIGAWYSGRWYVDTADYVDRVRTALLARAWTRPGF